jgi:hypothetical protein
MKKQSILLTGIHSAIDELELLLIEAEVLDIDIVEDLQKRFKKLEKLLNKRL